MLLPSAEYRHYKIAVLFSLLLSVVVAIFLLIYGKNDSFLVINKYNHPSFDRVFRYWTYLGEGLFGNPLRVMIFLLKREYVIAVIAGVLICTIITHFLKRIVFPDDFRPIVVLGEEKIRIIQGLQINRANSFPSGHTSTAFTTALLVAFIVRRNIWVFVFPLIAFFVGYSRVYLAQHFVTDVFAGMLIGIVSSWLSLLIYEKYRNRKTKHSMKGMEEEPSNSSK